jgi:hypothetical protein
MRAKLVVALSLLASGVAGVASADPHHVLVLKSEGPADAATRAKVDASLLKLAKHLDGKVTAGDITLGDAAAAVGCQSETPQCKDEVLATLAVDEVVATTVVPERNGNLKITVRRISKSGTQDATTTIAPAQTDKLDPISPLFGMPAAPGPAAPAPATAPTTVPPASPTPAISTTTPTGDTPSPETAPAPAPAPTPTPAALPAPATSPADVDDHSSRRKYELAGMIGGGGCVVLSFVLWGAASSTQSDIDKAPTKTTKDIQNLKDLESKGDAQAGLGNLLFVGGIALGVVSTYFYIKDRNSNRSTQARVVPTVFDHGAGLTLTIGGGP